MFAGGAGEEEGGVERMLFAERGRRGPWLGFGWW